MKDYILESYLRDFCHEFRLADLSESESFEHFVNYCIVAREYPEPFPIEDINVGGGGDSSIDGVAILVNDNLVSSESDVDYFKKQLKRLDVKFIFIQSKTSNKFDSGDLGNFAFGVKAFFENENDAPVNDEIQHLKKLRSYIYDASIDMDAPPECQLYYVTTGMWTDDLNLRNRIESELTQLKETNLFSNVSFTPMDGSAIRSLYKELRHGMTKEIIFDKHTILPNMKDVQEAYLGILPCSEYLKLVSDSEGRLLRNLFYDNVRDFQGNNEVNLEMEKTISNEEERDKFALLNNGITIVAKAMNKVGSAFKLKDYQIVNGCQTSHILYRNRNNVEESSYLSVKLIVTDNVEVANHITRATNRQTEVRPEAFESLAPFQKILEEFYITFGNTQPQKLFYERRSKQYSHSDIELHQVISLTAQVKCFVAMFLNEPHSTHRYYGELLEAYRNRIFVPNHNPFPYYVSAYALFMLEKLFFERKLSRELKAFKYQMLMIYRLLVEKNQIPYLNSHKIDAYCRNLMSTLVDEEKCLKTFKDAAQIIHEEMKDNTEPPNAVTRRKAFTSALIKNSNGSSEEANVERSEGIVKRFSNVLGYGFIAPLNGDEDLFVHYSNIRGQGFKSLSPGDKVNFTIVASERGPKAFDVCATEKFSQGRG